MALSVWLSKKCNKNSVAVSFLFGQHRPQGIVHPTNYMHVYVRLPRGAGHMHITMTRC
jgi:hypothetical protein